MEPAPTGALIICFGNPMRRDDGVALAVADLLAAHPGALPDGATVSANLLLDPALAQDIALAETVVFVDAERCDAPATPRTERLDALPADGLRANVHAVTPSDLLALAKRLWGRAPEATLVAVPAYDMGHGEGLSEGAKLAAEEAADLVRRLLRR